MADPSGLIIRSPLNLINPLLGSTWVTNARMMNAAAMTAGVVLPITAIVITVDLQLIMAMVGIVAMIIVARNTATVVAVMTQGTEAIATPTDGHPLGALGTMIVLSGVVEDVGLTPDRDRPSLAVRLEGFLPGTTMIPRTE